MARAKQEKKMVTINIPRDPLNESMTVSASVNGKVYLIKRGVNVKVPVELAEAIKSSDIAKEAAIAYIDGRKKENE